MRLPFFILSSLTQSDQGDESQLNPVSLLRELQDKMNENGELMMKIDNLSEELAAVREHAAMLETTIQVKDKLIIQLRSEISPLSSQLQAVLP